MSRLAGLPNVQAARTIALELRDDQGWWRGRPDIDNLQAAPAQRFARGGDNLRRQHSTVGRQETVFARVHANIAQLDSDGQCDVPRDDWRQIAAERSAHTRLAKQCFELGPRRASGKLPAARRGKQTTILVRVWAVPALFVEVGEPR